ncbi:MAG TPA: hypothetical protein VIH02_01250 [Flavobacterium sp.]
MDQYRVSLNTLNYTDLKEKSEIKHSGDIIFFDNGDLFGQSVIFKNKTFTCGKLIFENISNKEINIHFYNCTFNCELEFDTCTFEDLTFTSCDINSSVFVILNPNINYLTFRENTNDIRNVKTNNIKDGTIEINGGNINSIDIENIYFKKGKLIIINLDSIENCSIIRSTLNYVTISHCNFESNFEYIGNKNISRIDSAFFNHCKFNHSNFFGTTFNSDTKFSNCEFLSETKFESLESEIFTKIKFTDCEFFKSTIFNRALIHQLSFEKNVFIGQISLQETYFDIIKIDRTIFEKGAFFDDIQIKKIDNCDRRTIRTIKQELQKAENKIDFSRFRVYEFNAYRKDIRKKITEFKKDKNRFRHRKREPIQLKRDLFILNVSDIISEYGTDWKRAMKFTLITGLFWYCILYRYENSETLDFNNVNDFFVGAFRFFLVTDFHNPLIEESPKTYLTSGWSWLIFILGKIFIVFGIYEMIQSFRKFKA